MKTNIFKRIGAVLMMLALCISLTVPMEVNAASNGKSYYMPTKIINYKLVKGKWKKEDSYAYKYDKKGNISSWDGTKLNRVYKNGKLKKVTIKDKNDYGESFKTVKTYNSKGKIDSFECSYGNDDDSMAYIHEYKYNKKGYISKRVNMTDPDTYKYEYHSNGIPSKITHKYILYTEDGEYEVKTIEKYNKEGLVKSGVSYRNNKKYDVYKFKYTKKAGKVTQVLCSGKVKGKSYSWKAVFKYGKAKTKDRMKYISIMGMLIGADIFQSIGDNSAVGWCYEY